MLDRLSANFSQCDFCESTHHGREHVRAFSSFFFSSCARRRNTVRDLVLLLHEHTSMKLSASAGPWVQCRVHIINILEDYFVVGLRCGYHEMGCTVKVYVTFF